jgi:hypothetical protein
MSAAEALARIDDEKVEESTPQLGEALGPGIRIVDGRPMYSAAWIDFETSRAD